MSLFLFIILTTGLVATSVATCMSEAVLLKGQSVKGVARERILKGEKKSKTKTKKSAKISCPSVQAYVPPALCSDTCYSDVTTLFNDINNIIQKGTPFKGTMCQGTYNLVDNYVKGEVAGAEVTLRCCGPTKSCIIDGGGLARTRETPVFLFVSTVKQFVLEGLTFQNFKTPLGTKDIPVEMVNAVLRTQAASVVTIRHVVFKYNSGYAPLYFGTSSAVTIEGCLFTENRNDGGYFVAEGGSIRTRYSSVYLNGNKFYGNKAKNGGAAFFEDSSVDVTCNSFEQNQAYDDGGAVYGIYADLQLKGNIFFQNKAKNGGAAFFDDTSVVATLNSFEQNQADNQGGAVCTFYHEFEFSYNVFKENMAIQGGAFYVEYQKMISFENAFISNTASGAGGAIFGNTTVTKSTYDIFSLNSAAGDFGQNIHLKESILESECKSPIPGTTLVESIAFDDCI